MIGEGSEKFEHWGVKNFYDWGVINLWGCTFVGGGSVPHYMSCIFLTLIIIEHGLITSSLYSFLQFPTVHVFQFYK